MESIVLTINGKKISCQEGTSVFEAAAKNGIHIPSLCYHPDLKPYGACRLCLVEDEKTGRLFASCVTPAARDMVIQTDTPRVLDHRRNIIRLMMAEHPESCIVCNKGNRCQLRRIAADLGVGENDLYPMPNYRSFEQLNPFIVRDLSKCILCGKCIRADHELVCTGAIDYNLRGFRSRPATAHENAVGTFELHVLRHLRIHLSHWCIKPQKCLVCWHSRETSLFDMRFLRHWVCSGHRHFGEQNCGDQPR